MNNDSISSEPLCVTKEDIKKFLHDGLTRPFIEVAIEHGKIKVLDENSAKSGGAESKVTRSNVRVRGEAVVTQ